MQHRRIATPAAMLADPSRAAMVLALMDGRSRSAGKVLPIAGREVAQAVEGFPSWEAAR